MRNVVWHCLNTILRLNTSPTSSLTCRAGLTRPVRRAATTECLRFLCTSSSIFTWIRVTEVDIYRAVGTCPPRKTFAPVIIITLPGWYTLSVAATTRACTIICNRDTLSGNEYFGLVQVATTMVQIRVVVDATKTSCLGEEGLRRNIEKYSCGMWHWSCIFRGLSALDK